MSVLSSFQHNMMRPKYEKIEKDKLHKEHKNKILNSKIDTNHNTIVDMRSAMLKVRQDTTTFNQSFLNGTSSRRN